MNLAIDVDKNDSEYIVKLIGEVDVHTAPELKNQLVPLSELAGSSVKVDLSEVNFLDSTGLGVFIQAYKSSEQNGSMLKIINVRERVLRLFTITGLDEIIELSTEDI